MPNSAPAWIRSQEVVVVVSNVPVAPQPSTEVAAGAVGAYTGTDQTYQSLASWTVASGKIGDLKEILIISSLYAKTDIKISIAGTAWVTDWTPSSSMPIIFEDLKLVAGTVVLVEVKSTDGTSISVDCIIVAKEIG